MGRQTGKYSRSRGKVMLEKAPWQKLGTTLKLGLRALPEPDWLPFDDLFGDAEARAQLLEQKAALLRHHHAEVFAALPETEAAGAEVLALIDRHCAKHHAGAATVPIDRPSSLHPLDAAARLIPEDLLLLAPRPRQNGGKAGDLDWCLVAASLCFPAHWLLAEKMGLPLAAIHAPVPHYQERLAIPMDRFFTNMKTGPISTRMNWSLQLGAELFAPSRSERQAALADINSDAMRLRVESQTLRKLPVSGYVLFTIRTHMVPLQRWQDTPGAIQDLVAMLAEMSPETRDYKGAHLYEAALQQAVAALKGGNEGPTQDG